MSGARLTLDLGNAAFDGEDMAESLAWVLRNLADRIEGQTRAYLANNGSRYCARDINGNGIGFLELDIEDD